MTTVESLATIDPAVMADLEVVCNTRGIVRDPELCRRVFERAALVRREQLEKFGVQDIAAGIVRDMRDAG